MQDGRADKITPFVSTLDKAFANGFLKELFYSALGCRMTQSQLATLLRSNVPLFGK